MILRNTLITITIITAVRARVENIAENEIEVDEPRTKENLVGKKLWKALEERRKRTKRSLWVEQLRQEWEARERQKHWEEGQENKRRLEEEAKSRVSNPRTSWNERDSANRPSWLSSGQPNWGGESKTSNPSYNWNNTPKQKDWDAQGGGWENERNQPWGNTQQNWGSNQPHQLWGNDRIDNRGGTPQQGWGIPSQSWGSSNDDRDWNSQNWGQRPHQKRKDDEQWNDFDWLGQMRKEESETDNQRQLEEAQEMERRAAEERRQAEEWQDELEASQIQGQYEARDRQKRSAGNDWREQWAKEREERGQQRQLEDFQENERKAKEYHARARDQSEVARLHYQDYNQGQSGAQARSDSQAGQSNNNWANQWYSEAAQREQQRLLEQQQEIYRQTKEAYDRAQDGAEVARLWVQPAEHTVTSGWRNQDPQQYGASGTRI